MREFNPQTFYIVGFHSARKLDSGHRSPSHEVFEKFRQWGRCEVPDDVRRFHLQLGFAQIEGIPRATGANDP
jgi:hypothetical protein